MSGRRLMVVARDEFTLTLRRPMVWTLLALLLLLSWGIAEGVVQVALGSGDASVGGKKAFLTSQFAITQIMTVFTFTIYTFFAAAAAGLSVIRDDESRALEVLQATPLRPTEYAWGKFLGVSTAFLVVLAVNLAALILFLSVLPNADMLDVRGPFATGNYLVPALAIAVPNILFTTGVAFGVGTGTRRSILVFAAPIALLVLSAFFLWSWSPTWLSESWNRVLMFADPAAARWLSETYLKVDRGAEYYNTQRVGFDALFFANRLFWSTIGLGAAWLGIRRFTRTYRASHAMSTGQVSAALAAASAWSAAPAGSNATLASLQMTAAPLGMWATAWGAAGAESRELASRAGLYLFVPLIVLQLLGNSLTAIGAFDTPLLLTPGQLASSQMQAMATFVILLLVFYGVESMERERATRLDAIHDTLPISTGALLAGKLLALGVVWLVVALAAVLASAIIMLVQRKVAFSLVPFALLWGLLFLPTFLAFTTFVFATWTLVRNRYTTYGIALGVLGLTGWATITERLSWPTNWALWTGVRWTDMGTLEFDRGALVLNRLLWLSLAVAFWRMATRLYPRTARDTVSLVHAWSWPRLWRTFRRASPFLVAPVVLGATLARQVSQGPDGSRAEKVGKDYWKKNLATWRDAPFPWLKGVDVDLTIEPAARRYRVSGSYLIVNHRDTTLRQIPLTVGLWKEMRWTADGDSIAPDTASHLYLFTLQRPLGAGDSVRIGFRYSGDVSAPTEGRGGAGEFIIPSGVVMTNFGPRWFPYLGYEPSIGVDKDNRFEPRQYPEDWYVGTTPASFGSQLPMTVRTRITVPGDFIANGVGEIVSDSVHGTTHTVTWETDHPVMAFNVVAGRYAVKRGAGTALFYHPTHAYNVDEMLLALNASRRWYGEWFGTYPWKTLKISEFPALAGYAQGFPTNISFSEGIGFLTKSEPKTNLAFMVSAHEIAHQWWGNMLQPANGPGANLLSEGMAHFSTMLLMEQEKGERAGLELRTRFESRWGDGRRADAERKLYRIDGSKAGDGVVTYEKAGWTFWMLAERMGRDNALRGMKAFIARFQGGEDHAALEDFTAHMRAYAPDTAGYDDFVRQWFDTVSVLEYKVETATARRIAAAGPWETEALIHNVGNARMPVDIGVVTGERFPDDSTRKAKSPYAQALTRITISGGDTMTVTIRSPFEPEKVVIDPDVRVLQLRRKLAERKVEPR
ncbi:MAG: M1 family aminopeptidase [Gemmatimonadota bacterium]